ncbi:hypothetical protein B4N89_14365 [Embleya scabrispora]|uniref:Uncharacterized protein n=1 Tax=Embleya scabrispora TaxID=159449 RepID=A0A1T3NZ25_9ACTN|nr:hypothetical protein [Embleya scabrispora]OPC81962.1 hypothetical protein B4N89_14365 [Embleya scabrispora]
MSREASFVVGADGEAVPIVTAWELPPREPLSPPGHALGDWVAPLPGRGHDTYPAGRVERAEDCAGLDNDQVVMVVPPGGMPYPLKGSEPYRVEPPR